jgi:type I restriction-modification system DNA methylase subunit
MTFAGNCGTLLLIIPAEPTANAPMTAKQQLEATLWDIANALRGKMSADDFRDYILGFIFFKYLSEKMELYADEILHPDGITYDQIKPEAPRTAMPTSRPCAN